MSHMQYIRVNLDLFIHTDEAEEAVSALNQGLVRQLQDFPNGEVLAMEVLDAHPVLAEEAKTLGLVEEL
jgi:hypothetical protein